MLLTILLFLATICLFSFTDLNKEPPKKIKCFTCAAANNFSKVRSGNYVTISWQGPANAYYTYVAYTRVTGTFYSGTIYNTQITLQDNNEGGTITVTSHCTDGTTGSGTHFSWNPN